jgi:zinc transport system substrate-binding protein
MWRLLLLVSLLAPVVVGASALKVFVSVAPQETFVKRLGGEWVSVQAMVQPGYSPATYDPAPRQIAALAQADLYIRIGVPFEAVWMDRIRAANPDMAVLDVREGLDRRPIEAHAGGDDHSHAGPDDPHIWTSPPLVKAMSARIRDTLIRLAPEHRRSFEANYRAFAKELDELHQDLLGILAPHRGGRFMVFHPAWGYFADTYGLTQVPIEEGGKAPGPKALAALLEQARRQGIRVVFVQPQFARSAAEQVARALDGRVEVVDPLSPDYAENLRRVARMIAGATGL